MSLQWLLLHVYLLGGMIVGILAIQTRSHKLTATVCSAHSGCVRGKFMPGFQTEKFEAFLGIPYAMPPVGELRFSNPKAFPKWQGVLNATEVKIDCIQKNYLLPNPQVYGVEDCLYLNVYRPMGGRSMLLPVMVYIHGGGWFSGSASPQIHGPEYFMDTQDVILVTFAYRLGPLGFLSTDDNNMSGNFGLKDQNLVLRWVQKNIAAYGGNPKAVTLFGQSAGAISAHMHMLSKQSEGLFRGVIALSGTATVPFAITSSPLDQARKVADLCNISNAYELSTAKLTRALRNVDAVTLINAGDGLKYWDVDHLTNFRPVVENCRGCNAFLTQHPTRIIAEGNYKPVPWIAVVVPQEGAVRVLAIYENKSLRQSFNDNFDELFEEMMEFPQKFTDDQRREKTEIILEEYFGGQHELNNETVQGFLDTITDRGFHHPVQHAVKSYVKSISTIDTPVYLMKFNYRGVHTYANIFIGGGGPSERDYGVVHCDDLIYLFRSPMLFPDVEKNSTDARVIKAFVGHFVGFAKYGSLENTNLPSCNPYATNRGPDTFCEYVEFVNAADKSFEIKISNEFHVRRMKKWDDILK